jgi:hypothetical protein
MRQAHVLQSTSEKNVILNNWRPAQGCVYRVSCLCDKYGGWHRCGGRGRGVKNLTHVERSRRQLGPLLPAGRCIPPNNFIEGEKIVTKSV